MHLRLLWPYDAVRIRCVAITSATTSAAALNCFRFCAAADSVAQNTTTVYWPKRLVILEFLL